MTQIDEVAKGIYRISAFEPEFGITVNQFLIHDERPALIHTGLFQMYEDVRAAISEVLDPKRLSFVVCPHFEADECGGMGRFVEEAPEAVLACGEVGRRSISPAGTIPARCEVSATVKRSTSGNTNFVSWRRLTSITGIR